MLGPQVAAAVAVIVSVVEVVCVAVTSVTGVTTSVLFIETVFVAVCFNDSRQPHRYWHGRCNS